MLARARFEPGLDAKIVEVNRLMEEEFGQMEGPK
jgi:hypothetical protein